MAYLRKRSRSPYWFLCQRDLDTGRWLQVSTKLRIDDSGETRKALKRCDEASKREMLVAPNVSGEWLAWVPAYLSGHYSRGSSLKRFRAAWDRVSEFCKLKNIRHPNAVRYQNGQEFIDWRVGTGACHNTARLEVKFWSFLLQEAVRRGYCDGNVLGAFRIERRAVKEKGDIDGPGLVAARAGFRGRPTWMRTIFEICAHVGCRFSEASMPMSQIDFDASLIWIRDSKRKDTDPRRIYNVPLPDSLREYLRSLGQIERTAPVIVGDMNRAFNKVLKVACGETSHSLRVAFISRCHRAGLTESECMLLVNHSTAAVHKIYTRLNSADARRAMDRVAPPPLDGL